VPKCSCRARGCRTRYALYQQALRRLLPRDICRTARYRSGEKSGGGINSGRRAPDAYRTDREQGRRAGGCSRCLRASASDFPWSACRGRRWVRLVSTSPDAARAKYIKNVPRVMPLAPVTQQVGHSATLTRELYLHKATCSHRRHHGKSSINRVFRAGERLGLGDCELRAWISHPRRVGALFATRSRPSRASACSRCAG